MPMDDRHFGEVDCMHFDQHGRGPSFSKLAVRANVHPSPHYPEQPIYVGAWGETASDMDFGGNGLTVRDAIRLRDMLSSAIAETIKNAPHLVVVVEDLS